jgi:hypothetical protein
MPQVNQSQALRADSQVRDIHLSLLGQPAQIRPPHEIVSLTFSFFAIAISP